MRIIAGTAKGMTLAAPKGLDVRPTLDRVRESLFNILAPQIEGAAFLDLFAGTGANGIEALSRGAVSCVLVDNDARSLEIIRKNLEKTRLDSRAVVCRLDLPKGLERLTGKGGPFNVIFADPPYAFSDHNALLTGIETCRLLAPQGIVVLEHSSRSEIVEKIGHFQRFRQANYGETALSFFA